MPVFTVATAHPPGSQLAHCAEHPLGTSSHSVISVLRVPLWPLKMTREKWLISCCVYFVVILSRWIGLVMGTEPGAGPGRLQGISQGLRGREMASVLTQCHSLG